jgi:hypothetical protein
MKKLFVCLLQHSFPEGRGPGWYWWADHKVPLYHGPFDNETMCRADLARVPKRKLQKEVADEQS